MRNTKIIASLLIGGFVTGTFAQAAGAGADFNKSDRQASARQAEINRLVKYDKPVYPDPLGNALIGGASSAVVRGASAGVTAIISGTAAGTAVNAAKKR